MNKDFKEIVQAMSAKEIIMAMVEGLRNPYTKINMDTYGYKTYEGVCFGCAATNTVCRIIGYLPALPMQDQVVERGFSSSTISEDQGFIMVFEYAIDELRRGDIFSYNGYAEREGFATIKNIGPELPMLRDNYTEADLLPYIELANSQPTNP